jgi:hypothetical protein
MPTFRLPTIPYSIIDAVNRAAAATGSVRTGMCAHRADYNGHYVTVSFNEYRKYWVTEYSWAGRVVLARGSFENCLSAGIKEYRRGALGTTIAVTVGDDELDYAQLALLEGFIPAAEAESKEAEWQDARYKETHHALTLERQCGLPATSILIQSATVEEYRERLETERKERNAAQHARWLTPARV